MPIMANPIVNPDWPTLPSTFGSPQSFILPVSAPASQNAPGTINACVWDGAHIYVYTAAGWARTRLDAGPWPIPNAATVALASEAPQIS
jgi:hypothetical protein